MRSRPDGTRVESSCAALRTPVVVLALVVGAAWLAPQWPDLTVPLQALLGSIGCLVITASAWRAGGTPTDLGIRVDNVLPACLAFALPTSILCAPAVLASRGDSGPLFPATELPGYLSWALFQQFVAIGGFWMPFRRAAGLAPGAYSNLGRELSLAAAAGLVFALAHAPNTGLMALTGLAETVWLTTFARWRNLVSLSLAHAAAALVVSHHLVPSTWLPSMRVGISYLRP